MLKEIYDDNFELVNFKGLKKEWNILMKILISCFLDLNLPDSQGIETFNTMNKYAPELPIIILTGLVDEELAINIVSEGAQDYL